MTHPVQPANTPLLVEPKPVADVADVATAKAQAAESTKAKAASAQDTASKTGRQARLEEPVASDLRLIIEESVSGHYVYTVVDRRTGDVVSRLPHDEVLRLKDQPGYKAGDVYTGQA